MDNYIAMLNKVLMDGERKVDRTGVGTRSIFGGQIAFNLRHMSLPLVTIKETKWKSAFIEMLWFIRGEDNTDYLKHHGVKIWDAWAKDGKVGPIYGVQWRHWTRPDRTEVDQLKQLIQDLKNNPNSRRHIVTAWNPGEIEQMSLPPCHYTFQCYVSEGKKLTLMLNLRSWDLGLGAPFNIAQYALLTHLLAQCTGLWADKLIINFGDAHIYENHVKDLYYLIHTEKPHRDTAKLKILNPTTDIDGFSIEDFEVEDYTHNAHLPLPIAV